MDQRDHIFHAKVTELSPFAVKVALSAFAECHRKENVDGAGYV